MEEITLPNIETVKEKENFGVFVIQPLYPGYGHTLGSSLRRILLSSLEGAAISSIKVEGISHQFSTISGVREDVNEIILNLKNVSLKIHGDEPVHLALNIKGPKEVRAKDIKTPSSAEIVNSDLYLATVEDKAVLSIEMTAEKGRGYLPVETRPAPSEVGMIAIDSLFSPILLVNVKVENTRVGQRTDFNKLTLEIKTDGTIKPSEALKKSVEILSRQIEPIKNIQVKKEDRKLKVKEKPKDAKRPKEKEIKDEKTSKKKGVKRSASKKSR